MLHLLLTAIIFLLYMLPLITEIISDFPTVHNIYDGLCVYDLCRKKTVLIPVLTFLFLVALIGFIFLMWLLILNCKKFSQDGAKLADQNEGN